MADIVISLLSLHLAFPFLVGGLLAILLLFLVCYLLLRPAVRSKKQKLEPRLVQQLLDFPNKSGR